MTHESTFIPRPAGWLAAATRGREGLPRRLSIGLFCLAMGASVLHAVPAAAQDQATRAPEPQGSGQSLGLDPSESPQRAAAPAAPPGSAAPAAPLALPPDPARAARPVVFGSQIFTGRFGNESLSSFNPDYQVTVGDRITLRMWGAFSYQATQAVDAQGNLFVPNVGPVRLLGVRNADLNTQLENQLKRVFRANVGVYATLEAAQPVKVFVTGFVRAPGLYGGRSSDTVLSFLDRAGGIDPDRGSYLHVDVLRQGIRRARINLYRFLLDGQIEQLQLQDGDTIVATPRKHVVLAAGEVANPYLFEFESPRIAAEQLLTLARPRPGATHMAIVRKIGAERRSEYHPLTALAGVDIADGDEVTFTSDKFPGTILVRIEGAHQGERTLVLPYGSKLVDALSRLKPAPQARLEAAQLFRKSVAVRQRELLEGSLRNLETYALTARSSTSEEASLRQREGDQILKFIERARSIQPRGQIIIAGSAEAGETLLEDGDLIRIPELSNLVLVSGEVLFPNAVIFKPGEPVQRYVQAAGGYTQTADRARLLVMRQDGSVSEGEQTELRAGDEIMVLPRIETKSVEVARGLTQILFQIAVVAKTALGL